jgi:hypothetical protein
VGLAPEHVVLEAELAIVAGQAVDVAASLPRLSLEEISESRHVEPAFVFAVTLLEPKSRTWIDVVVEMPGPVKPPEVWEISQCLPKLQH